MRLAVEILGSEILNIRAENRRHYDLDDGDITVHMGPVARMHLRDDPEFMAIKHPNGADLDRFYGALVYYDSKLPPQAVVIKVKGVPYTTITLEPQSSL